MMNCVNGGGEAITIEDRNGNAVETSCSLGTSVLTCNWSTDSCTLDTIQPTSDPFYDDQPDGGVGGDVGNEDLDPAPTAPPTASGPVMTEQTATSGMVVALTMPDITSDATETVPTTGDTTATPTVVDGGQTVAPTTIIRPTPGGGHISSEPTLAR